MEIYSSTTRFALACNNSTKIIEPIQSRCAVLRFSKLHDGEILTRLQQVAAMENVTYDSSGLEALIFIAEVQLSMPLLKCRLALMVMSMYQKYYLQQLFAGLICREICAMGWMRCSPPWVDLTSSRWRMFSRWVVPKPICFWCYFVVNIYSSPFGCMGNRQLQSIELKTVW